MWNFNEIIFSRAKSEGPLMHAQLNGNSPSDAPSTPTSPGVPTEVPRAKKKSLANMFLPSNNEDAILVLKKVSVQISRKSSMDSGIGLQDDDPKKKSVTKMASTDKGEQKKLSEELCKRLTYIAEKMAALNQESEDIQQRCARTSLHPVMLEDLTGPSHFVHKLRHEHRFRAIRYGDRKWDQHSKLEPRWLPP